MIAMARIDSQGNIDSGVSRQWIAGVQHTHEGVYVIDFQPAFPTNPVIMVTAASDYQPDSENFPGAASATVTSTRSQATIVMRLGNGDMCDVGFNVIAMTK